MSLSRNRILLVATLFSFGCGRSQPATDLPKPTKRNHENRQLLGVWETDAELTKSLPENQSLDSHKLRSDAWLFGIQMKRRETFFPDGRMTIQLCEHLTEFNYAIIKRDGDQLTLRRQVKVDPNVREFAASAALDPFESEWLIVGLDKIANRMKGECGTFWMVYRRVGETWNTSGKGAASHNWENAKREALASPPMEWFCAKTDSYEQKHNFHDWYFKTPFLVPEVYPAVNDWLDGPRAEIDTIITNMPTGAQYRITGKRQTGSIQCSVKFIGNVNWK